MNFVFLFFWPLLSGLLSGVTLPTAIGNHRWPDLGILAWISLVPLYLVLSKKRSPFKEGFVWGVGFYGISLYWIFIAMHTYGDVPAWGSLLGVTLAVVIMAFFSAAASWGAVWLARRGIPFALAFVLLWVVQDFARTYFPFGGFAWSSLGYSQHSFLTLLQMMDLTGVYGVTFVLVVSNAFFAELYLFSRREHSFPKILAVSAAALFMSTMIYGKIRLMDVRKDLASRQMMTMALVQGNIPEDEKWQDEKSDEIIRRHFELTQVALKQNPAFLIWPEAAYPMVVPADIQRLEIFQKLTVPLLMGVVTYDGEVPSEWPPKKEDKSFHLYNSALLIEPKGFVSGRYHKNHLVPMGEYVPLQEVFYFLKNIVPSISGFTPGHALNLLGRGDIRFGVTICYEDLFPEISRAFVREGADFLVNLTNDGWYEHSSAVYQHFDFSRFRAIENRRAMARATNTGVTAFFSPTGEVIASAPVFSEAVLSAVVPIGGPGSFYTAFGDLFAWGCFFEIVLLVLKATCLKNSKNG
jgi:apolipoprotein N-acyltransferase